MSEATEGRLEAWLALLRAQAVLTDAVEADLLASNGLPLAWHEALVRVSRAGPGGLRMQELARAVLLSKSGLTRLADRMEAAGLIERRRCPSDRRGTHVVLTDAGRRKLRVSGPVFRRAVERQLSGPLSDDEVATLRTLLRKVSDGAQREPEDCTPADIAALAGSSSR
jgi:DNA-binding MarR family transcriptional regulator